MSCKCSVRTTVNTLIYLFVIGFVSICDARDCTLKVTQYDREIVPKVDNNISTYKLMADAFKIEGNDPTCPPYGIFPIADSKDIDYLLQTPLIISPAGLSIAEYPDTFDVFGGNGGSNPSTTIDEMTKYSMRDAGRAKEKYNELCKKLEYCPTPAMAYHRGAPFFQDNKRGYAEFKRWTRSSPMSAAVGLQHRVVVYSTVQTIAELANLLLIKPHILIFDFQPTPQMAKDIQYAQDIKPVPADLSQLPNIGVQKDEAVKFLDKVVQFSEQKEKYGLSLLSGKTKDGAIHVAFKLANKRVIAGSIAVPDSSQHGDTALKFGMLIRFLMNLVPEVDWNAPDQSQLLGSAVAKISSDPSAALSKTIGQKFIFAVRDPQTGLVKFAVVNLRMKTERFDIGKF